MQTKKRRNPLLQEFEKSLRPLQFYQLQKIFYGLKYELIKLKSNLLHFERKAIPLTPRSAFDSAIKRGKTAVITLQCQEQRLKERIKHIQASGGMDNVQKQIRTIERKMFETKKQNSRLQVSIGCFRPENEQERLRTEKEEQERLLKQIKFYQTKNQKLKGRLLQQQKLLHQTSQKRIQVRPIQSISPQYQVSASQYQELSVRKLQIIKSSSSATLKRGLREFQIKQELKASKVRENNIEKGIDNLQLKKQLSKKKMLICKAMLQIKVDAFQKKLSRNRSACAVESQANSVFLTSSVDQAAVLNLRNQVRKAVGRTHKEVQRLASRLNQRRDNKEVVWQSL